ncbi:serine/threonine-protein kinase [Qaidamihabitans albus]|uniref:serine/threonine-protein kinase n=1 Tax=Qaidamihabitans albus TaxID=2795733 RepID=UPI0018F19840|nr:serine/threonine-protein kinase [Qaidamihabitans albus]
MSDDEGRLVAGRYRLQGRIGSGAMGVVWRAVDERLDRVVAVKQVLLPPGLSEAEAESARQRAFREGRIAARLQHPNAIAVYNVAEDSGRPVLVMEYLPSQSLAAVLDERGILPPAEVARIGGQTASALAAAHAAGVIHRDIKPGNILLGHDGAVKITDFGISRAAGDITVTKTGLLAGTPAFLSPESARGEEPGPASDVFSLGATLYAAVEGRPPFGGGGNEIALLHTVATGRVEPPRQAGPLTGPLQQMLQPEAGGRPTMPQVADLLNAVAGGRSPVGVEPPTMPASRPASTRLDMHAAAPAAPRAAPAAAAAAAPAGRSGRRVAYYALALLAAAAVGVLVAEFLVSAGQRSAADDAPPSSSAPPAPGTSSSPATPTTPTAEPVSDEDLRDAVTEYYALLPERTGQAWDRLGPGLREQGEKEYERFWGDVKKVKVIAGPRVAGKDLVEVRLEFDMAGTGKFRETHRLGMLTRDGAPLIDSDELVSSVRLDDENDENSDNGDNGDNDKKDDKKDDKDQKDEDDDN